MTSWRERMAGLRSGLRHPLGRAAVLLVLAYAIFKFGIAYIPPLFGIPSAPVPASVMLQYMLTALVGILIYVSDEEGKWRLFRAPIHRTMVDPERRWLRRGLLVLLPVLVGFVTWQQVRPRVAAPIELRSIHPAPPSQITFRGRTIQLTGLENPLRSSGSLDEHYATGQSIYYQNCLPCHGDLLDGEGHFGHGFSPRPLPFDAGTIAQLTESFVFWRVAKGGPGLPREGAPWSSAMPAWEDFLTEEEIWAVIIFLYQQSGRTPRTWEAGHD
ncbi:MAG TPA: cytochrome c [Gemmatimonadaceae bacterium]|nr:cytochrome c [Gemmatimonadaceae bacterium]